MEKCEAFGGYKGIMHNCPWPWDWLGSLQKVLPFKFTFLGKVCEHKPVCKKYYAPRGAMDNSLYNDTFELSNSTGKINWTFDELLLPEERLLYAHPKRLPNETLCDAYKKRTVRPKSWTKDVCELDPNNENNTGFKNFDFVVWMISTINSRVRKIYKRFDVWELHAEGPKQLPKFQQNKIVFDFNNHVVWRRFKSFGFHVLVHGFRLHSVGHKIVDCSSLQEECFQLK
ncbi:hypothetical protein M3Y98_00371800 [Aphelenchoides besseyi]|nr:hypothetical protein M3Y98_00371800 [Aphelenchoides besseyi]